MSGRKSYQDVRRAPSGRDSKARAVTWSGDAPVTTGSADGAAATAGHAVVAARNNARWCNAMGRAHGIEGCNDADAWTSARRMPPLYPDAVTLRAGVDAGALVGRIEPSPGGAVKDSFADIDLGPHGFRTLFNAQWLHRSPGTPTHDISASVQLHWTPVRDATGLGAWDDAWQRCGGCDGVFVTELLDEADIVMLAGRQMERIVAGAVVTVSDGVAGLSNVFADPEPDVERGLWPGCLAWLDRSLPDRSVVGYEAGDALRAAARHGFRPVGPLRVWVRSPAS